MQNRCEKVAMIAFAANAVLHAMALLDVTSISLTHTWPAHLLAVGMFVAMMIRLVSKFGTQAQALSRMDRESLHAYRDDIEREGLQQTVWVRMFGSTPGWVGAVVLVLAVYSFGSFLFEGLQRPWSTVTRGGEAWYYDDYDGWVRRVTPEDAIQDQKAELRAATSLCALFAFIPWAYFRFSDSQRRSEYVRNRKYQYSRLAGLLPTWPLVMIVLGTTLPITFFATMPDHVWILAIHFLTFGMLATVRSKLMPELRKRALQRAAESLGLNYAWSQAVAWFSPQSNHSTDACFNVLRGKLNGLDVTTFDCRVERWNIHTDRRGSRTDTRLTSFKYNIVQLRSDCGLANGLIAACNYGTSAGIAIPGTKYRLSSSDERSQQRVAQMVTDEVVEFLAQNPGWVIELQGNRLTAFDNRAFTNCCRAAANLPAFLEDVMHLHALLKSGLDGSGTHEVFSLDRVVTPDGVSSADRYLGDRLKPLVPTDSKTSNITAFGCLWLLMCLLFFSAAFSSPGGDEPILYVFAPVFTLIGLGCVAPGIIRFISRPSYDVSVPEIRVHGNAPPQGGCVRVSFRQRNKTGQPLHDVTVSLKLGRRELRSQAEAHRWTQYRDKFSSDWKRGWESEQTFDVGVVGSGETISLDHEFEVSDKLTDRLPDDEWWAIDVKTNCGDHNFYAGTFLMARPATIASSLFLPGAIIGGIWGFSGLSVIVATATEAASGAPWMFGFVALSAFAGALGGAILGVLMMMQLSKVAFGRKIAEAWGAVNVVFQFIGSFVVGFGTFLFAFYLADDVYDLFGWQSAPAVDARSALEDPDSAGRNDDLAAERLTEAASTRSGGNRYSKFQHAVLRGTPEDVRAILARDPEGKLTGLKVTGNGTALHQAAYQARNRVAEVLLEFGADPNAKGPNNRTPLHIACANNRPLIVRLLLEHGADARAKDAGGLTPIDLAKRANRSAVLEILEDFSSKELDSRQ